MQKAAYGCAIQQSRCILEAFFFVFAKVNCISKNKTNRECPSNSNNLSRCRENARRSVTSCTQVEQDRQTDYHIAHFALRQSGARQKSSLASQNELLQQGIFEWFSTNGTNSFPPSPLLSA